MLFMLCRPQDFYDFDYANETGQLLQFLRLEEGDLELPARQVALASLPEVRSSQTGSNPLITAKFDLSMSYVSLFTIPFIFD